jgi:rhamnosyltransferase
MVPACSRWFLSASAIGDLVLVVKTPSNIAVLLAAYNGMQWIEEQIDSILNQRNTDVKIFISVDLSIDGTYEWCQALQKRNPRVVVLPYGERFGGAAKNFFRLIRDVDFSNFDFVSLADQDDIWLPNKLQHAISLIKLGGYDAVSSDVIAFWEDGREKMIKKSYPQKIYDYLFEAAGPGCTYVFKASAVINFQKFLWENRVYTNEVALHDWMIYAFFRTYKYNWYIDTLPLIKYRQHSSNVMGLNLGFKAFFKRIKLVKNKFYRKEVEKIKSLLKLNISTNLWFRIKNFLQLRRRFRDSFILLILSIFGFY